MMAPRAVDEGAWMQFARSLVEAGAEAAAAAQARDVERVFASGEQVYNVCTACHGRYATGLQRVSGAN
jgi:cytochrome c5